MNLATIQNISKISQHDNADSLELATIKGWQIVVKKGEFSEGDLCVYVALDSILPEKPEFEFMRNKSFRVKSIRLRGEISQGIVFPLCILPFDKYEEGQDVTELIGIIKYEKPIPTALAGKIEGMFPVELLRKTDEERLQNEPKLIDEIGDDEIFITIKYDGTSGTFIKHENKLRVCSRNLELKNEEGNAYWRIAAKYNLENIPDGFAVQGEIVGGSIQGDPAGIGDIDLRVFNVVDLSTTGLLPLHEFREFCQQYGLPMVKVVYEGPNQWKDVKAFLDYVETVKYDNGKQAEGVVVRKSTMPFHKKLQKPFSFKVISNSYALKHGE